MRLAVCLVRCLCVPLLCAGMLAGCTMVGREGQAYRRNYVFPDRAILSDSAARYFDSLFLEAVRQRLKGNSDAAAELLAEVLRINPDASEALYELALLHLSAASFSDTIQIGIADSLLRRAVAEAPENIYYKETLAALQARLGHYVQALTLYEMISEVQPTSENLMMLVGLYEQSGDRLGAIRAIERLERIEGPAEEYAVEKFKLYSELGDDEHAYAAIEHLCAEYPNDLRYRVLLGDMYQEHGFSELALATYLDVLSSEPDNSFAQISLLAYYKNTGADSLYTRLLHDVVLNPRATDDARVEAMRGYAATSGDTAAVLRLFREAVARPLDSRSLPELYAAYLLSIGQPENSLVPAMRRILDVEPDYSPARLQLLQILLKDNDLSQIVSLCREGEMYDPSNVLFYFYDGMALLSLDRDAEAVEVLERGAGLIDGETSDDLASDLYASLGDLYHREGNHAAAYIVYEKALDRQPDNLFCLNNYAYFLSLDGKNLERAEEMSRRTVEAEPDNHTYLDTYAWVLYQQKRYQQARIYIDQTLRLTEAAGETDATLLEHAADIYLRVGLRREARAFLQRAVDLAETAGEKGRLRRKLRRF